MPGSSHEKQIFAAGSLAVLAVAVVFFLWGRGSGPEPTPTSGAAPAQATQTVLTQTVTVTVPPPIVTTPTTTPAAVEILDQPATSSSFRAGETIVFTVKVRGRPSEVGVGIERAGFSGGGGPLQLTEGETVGGITTWTGELPAPTDSARFGEYRYRAYALIGTKTVAQGQQRTYTVGP